MAPFAKILAGVALLLVAGGSAFYLLQSKAPDIPLVDASAKQLAEHYDAPAGICPWRDADTEMKVYFPQATAHREQLVPLSIQKQEIEKRLGRRLTGEETGLPLHIVLHDTVPLGCVVAKRVRGTSGVIEIVLALETNGVLKNWKVQRLREPEKAATFLRSRGFSQIFWGRSGVEESLLFTLPRDMPSEAQASAKAIADTIRTVLILYAVALKSSPSLGQK